MFEYIKRVSIAISFIARKVDGSGTKVKELLESLSLDLLMLAQNFREEKYKGDDLQKIADKISYLIDVVDFARINGLVSQMNARLFVESQINFLKHILNLLEQKNSLSIPLYQLKQLDDVFARKSAKENIANKSFDFSFTNIPEHTPPVGHMVQPTLNKEGNSSKEPEIVQKKIVEESILYPETVAEVSKEVSPEHVEKEISERRARILKVLTTGGGSIREIASKLRDINEKTLQRDLLELMRDKKIIMLGKKRWAKYYLK